MKDLIPKIKSCNKCKISKNTQNKTIGKGSFNPKVVFVGLNPGIEENKTGVPFVGKSGKLLDQWISYLGLDNDTCTVINLIKCFTPNESGLDGEEFDNCKPFFDRQIEILKPDLIVPLGASVFHHLSGLKTPILQASGKKHAYKGIDMIPLPHPSFFVRQGGHGWEKDVKHVKEYLDGETVDYVPLHVHTEYSIGDVAGKITDNLNYAKSVGMNTVAITDHGTIAGWFDFQSQCDAFGIKPILGTEFYVVGEYHTKSRKRYHVVALAKDEQGVKNLYKLTSKANTDGFYYKPRISLADLLDHKEGLVISSACTGGILSQRILEGDMEGAVRTANRLKQEFGDDFYIELQPHDFKDQKITNPSLIKIANDLGIKTIITTDVHYKNRDDKKLHNAVKAISFRKKYGEANFTGDTHCFLSPSELIEAAKKTGITEEQIKEAMRNTHEVAQKCNGRMIDHGPVLPEIEIPGEEDNSEYLRKHCESELERIGFVSDVYRERLAYELEMIEDKGFVDYILIIRDMIKEAEDQGIMVGPGRGSAGGSLVCYLLGITKIDPIEHDLLFERFIAPSRKDFPDIDTDFQSSRREEVVQNLKDKYGEDCVAQIPAIYKFGLKQAIRDLSRIFSIPIPEVNMVTKKIPDKAIMSDLDHIPEAIAFLDKYPNIKELLPKLDGMIRHRSVHAAGIVITPGPIKDFLALEKISKNFCTCFDKDALEQLGFLKVDILGLKTLDVIDSAIKMSNEHIELPKQFNDPRVYELLREGRNIGIFQAEKGGISKLLQDLEVEDFNTLYDATSLYRPGPLGSGQTDEYIRIRKNRRLRNEDG